MTKKPVKPAPPSALIHGRACSGKGQSTGTPDGYVLTPYDQALEEQIQAGREFMREFRDTFHQLAK